MKKLGLLQKLVSKIFEFLIGFITWFIRLVIFIGDVTILILSLPWKALKVLSKLLPQEKVVERVIYNPSASAKKKKGRF